MEDCDLWEVSVVQAAHQAAMLAEPAPQQGAPSLVANCPRTACAVSVTATCALTYSCDAMLREQSCTELVP